MSIELTIVTPNGPAFEGTVDSVVLPGSEGEFGVLELHERTLAPLKVGPVQIRTGSVTEWAVVSTGFADVSSEQVVVMVDRCELGRDVDVAAAEKARDDAMARHRELSGSDEHERQRAEIESEVSLAEALIAVAGRH